MIIGKVAAGKAKKTRRDSAAAPTRQRWLSAARHILPLVSLSACFVGGYHEIAIGQKWPPEWKATERTKETANNGDSYEYSDGDEEF
jgi:hypothetical protein